MVLLGLGQQPFRSQWSQQTREGEIRAYEQEGIHTEGQRML